MKKRIFVCAEIIFPRGAAGSNLTLCYCKLFKKMGYDVTVIGLGGAEKGDFDDESQTYEYEGIRYTTIASGAGVVGKINSKILIGKNTIEKLRSFGITKDDLIMIYASNGVYIKKIGDFARKNGIKAFNIVVEWHQPFQYPFGKYDIRYRSNEKGFNKYVPQIGNVVAISKLLDTAFKERGCHTTIIPVMIDYERNKDMFSDRTVSDTEPRNFIYAGNPFGKDDMLTMLRGIELLSEDIRKRMKFYWVGVKREIAVSNLKENAYLLDELSDCIEIREWLNYDELLKLYEKMDFLYFSREDNTVSNAGFPSKVPEAMLQGLVPVINRVGDCPDYLTDGEDSFIFDDDTPEKCCEGLSRAVEVSSDKLRNMRSSAFECAKGKFDYSAWDKVMSEFLINLK